MEEITSSDNLEEIIKRGTVSGIKVNFKYEYNSIQNQSFHTCIFNDLTIVLGPTIQITFTECVFNKITIQANEGCLIIFKSRPQVNSLYIESPTTNRKCKLISSTPLVDFKKIKLININCTGGLENFNKIKNIYLENCDFNNCYIKNSFNISILNTQIANTLAIKDNYNNGKVNIVGINYNILFYNLKNKKIHIDNFESKLIRLGEIYDSEIIFSESYSNQTKCLINDCSFNNFIVAIKNKFIELDVFNTTFNGKLNISNIDLSNSVFNSVDFSNPNCEIIFDRSYIADTIFSNIKWKKNYRLSEFDMRRENLEIKRDVYRQLKYSLEKQSNKIDAIHFEKLELEIYFQYILNHDSNNYKDKIILWTYKNLGGWGLDWLQPLKWWLSIHSFIFALSFLFSNLIVFKKKCVLITPLILCKLSTFVYNLFFLIGKWFFYAYPLHKLPENLPESIFSILMKITSGIFIFYIIKASRKFHKG